MWQQIRGSSVIITDHFWYVLLSCCFSHPVIWNEPIVWWRYGNVLEALESNHNKAILIRVALLWISRLFNSKWIHCLAKVWQHITKLEKSSSDTHCFRRGNFFANLSSFTRFRQVQNTASCHNFGTRNLNSFKLVRCQGAQYTQRSWGTFCFETLVWTLIFPPWLLN